ncbi:MAG: alginate lyase family protein, partial [Planctomycetes bacterium]|nr:alginate lyase family protein [Planctomycetota bacterium]
MLDKRHVPPSGDKRDYFSLSVYFWPDPAKPDGLPYIPRDAQLNPETEDYDGPRFAEMSRSVDTLATAYAISGDERYAGQAAAFLRAWFLDPVSAMRPNMLFAQYIPGDDVVLPWKEYPARFVPGSGGRPGVFMSYGGTIE